MSKKKRPYNCPGFTCTYRGWGARAAKGQTITVDGTPIPVRANYSNEPRVDTIGVISRPGAPEVLHLAEGEGSPPLVGFIRLMTITVPPTACPRGDE